MTEIAITRAHSLGRLWCPGIFLLSTSYQQVLSIETDDIIACAILEAGQSLSNSHTRAVFITSSISKVLRRSRAWFIHSYVFGLFDIAGSRLVHFY